MILSPHEMAWCLKEVGFDGTDVPTGLPNIVVGVAIGLAESNGNTDVMGRSTTGENLGQRDHGWMQISGRWHWAKLLEYPNWRNPLVNARLAKLVFDETALGKPSGWTAWSTYNKPSPTTAASYEKWLPDAKHGAAHPFEVIIPEDIHGRVLAEVRNIPARVTTQVAGLTIQKLETISFGTTIEG